MGRAVSTSALPALSLSSYTRAPTTWLPPASGPGPPPASGLSQPPQVMSSCQPPARPRYLRAHGGPTVNGRLSFPASGWLS